jgi:heme exporter protein C
MYGKGLRGLSVATSVALVGAFALVAFYAPLDVDQGFRQKIFYLHVPMAIVALIGFIAGGLLAIQHLRTNDPKWDLRSYVAIHISLILAVGVLITGAIWAKTSWGVWWVWDEPTLVSFLIVFLLYATYTPMRFAIEDRERQARYASVFAITAGAFVPICFGAVRAQQTEVHPHTFGSGDLPGPMWLTFLVSLVAMALLFVTLCQFEIATKTARGRMRSLRRQLLNDDTPVLRRSAAPTL